VKEGWQVGETWPKRESGVTGFYLVVNETDRECGLGPPIMKKHKKHAQVLRKWLGEQKEVNEREKNPRGALERGFRDCFGLEGGVKIKEKISRCGRADAVRFKPPSTTRNPILVRRGGLSFNREKVTWGPKGRQETGITSIHGSWARPGGARGEGSEGGIQEKGIKAQRVPSLGVSHHEP